MSDEVGDLSREVGLLVRRLRGWAGSSWDVPLESGITRAERTRLLLDELAILGERVGTGAPAGARPPRLAPHALPDQLAVLAEDLLAALLPPAAGPSVDVEPSVGAGSSLGAGPPGTAVARRGREVLVDAYAAVTRARADLDGAGFGFRVR
jgi:hypothetical protein